MKVIDKKYELILEDSIRVDDSILYRIKALRDFGSVSAGTIGGYIEKEANLAQEGSCWVADNAMVYENARVYENGQIHGNAVVKGKAQVYNYGQVGDFAIVSGKAQIYHDGRVREWAKVSGNAEVYNGAVVEGFINITDDAQIYGCCDVRGKGLIGGKTLIMDSAEIDGEVSITGDTNIGDASRITGRTVIQGENNVILGKIENAEFNGNARISHASDYLTVRGIGMFQELMTFYKTENGIRVVSGNFVGTLDEFKKQATESYPNTLYLIEYSIMMELVKVHFRL